MRRDRNRRLLEKHGQAGLSKNRGVGSPESFFVFFSPPMCPSGMVKSWKGSFDFAKFTSTIALVGCYVTTYNSY